MISASPHADADTTRPRILHVVDSLGVGGTENVLATLIERTQNHVQHSVCCIREAGPMAPRVQARGVAVTVVGKAPGHDWSLPLRIAKLCRAQRPDVVHSRNWGSIDAIVGARLAGTPVVIHGEHGRDAADPHGSNTRRNRARRLLAHLADRMVAVSEQLRQWLIHDVGVRASKVCLLRNGVDISRFHAHVDRDVLRARHGFAPTDFIVGTVGRLDAVKNQTALVDLATQVPDVHVVIVGDGPERSTLEQHVERQAAQRTVHLLGQRDDVADLLAMFDVFVLPSLAEGMCNTILEAMASGLPVVATGVGGNPELVADGVTGALVPPRDAQALTQAVERYARDARLRQLHGAAGRQRVQQDFTLDAMVNGYLALYQSELGRKNGRRARNGD
jgi:sugar transferase (PEP-CTERM/EpsH1 system associated)